MRIKRGQRNVKYEFGQDGGKLVDDLIKSAAPIPKRTNRRKLAKLRKLLDEARDAYLEEEKKCQHAVKDRWYERNASYDTLGMIDGYSENVHCRACNEIIYHEHHYSGY